MSQFDIAKYESLLQKHAYKYAFASDFLLSTRDAEKAKLYKIFNILFIYKHAPECIDLSKFKCDV